MHSHRPAPWRLRFQAPRLSLPYWARAEPERLLYRSTVSGKWEIHAWDRRTGRHRQVTDRAAGTLHARLEPAGQWIWWFDDEAGTEQGLWRREPFWGGESARLAAPELPPAYPAGLALGDGFAMVASSLGGSTTLHRVAGRELPVLLLESESETWLGALSADDRMCCLDCAASDDSRHPALRVIDLSGGTVAELDDGPGRGLWSGEWSPLRGDDVLLVTHERREMPRPALWSVRDGSVRDLPVDLPGEVFAGWFPDGQRFLISHDSRGRTELFTLGRASGELRRIEHEPGSIVAAAARPDGAVWYELTSGVLPPRPRCGGELLLPVPGEPPPGRPFRDLVVGGVHSFLAVPDGPPPHPTVFLVHGGPHEHWEDVYSPRALAWAEHGFLAVQTNYRGSTGYGSAWRDAVEGNPGFTELADLRMTRDHLVREGLADPGRLVLNGKSWGGYLALLAAGTDPHGWSLAIADAPIADYVATYEQETEELRAFDRSLFGGSPAGMAERYRDRSPITYVDRVRIPLLVLFGASDPRCPSGQIEAYLRRLSDLGRSYEVHRHDEGHVSLRAEEIVRQVELQLAFCARHLGTPAPA